MGYPKFIFSGVALYFFGGEQASSSMTKISLPSETTSGLSLAVGRGAGPTGFSNAGVAGYVAGGGNADASNFERFSFPTDVRTVSATGIFTSTRNYSSSFSNYEVAGYVSGGGSGVDKIFFPSETRANILIPFSFSSRAAEASDSGTAGYLSSGQSDSATVNKVSFSTDTVSNLAVGLSRSINSGAGFANIGVAAYFGSGAGSGGTATAIDKFSFPSDTRTVLASGISTVNGYVYYRMVASSVSGSAGYFTGGLSQWDNRRMGTSDKISFPTDTKTVISAGYAVSDAGAMANE